MRIYYQEPALFGSGSNIYWTHDFIKVQRRSPRSCSFWQCVLGEDLGKGVTTISLPKIALGLDLAYNGLRNMKKSPVNLKKHPVFVEAYVATSRQFVRPFMLVEGSPNSPNCVSAGVAICSDGQVFERKVHRYDGH